MCMGVLSCLAVSRCDPRNPYTNPSSQWSKSVIGSAGWSASIAYCAVLQHSSATDVGVRRYSRRCGCAGPRGLQRFSSGPLLKIRSACGAGVSRMAWSRGGACASMLRSPIRLTTKSCLCWPWWLILWEHLQVHAAARPGIGISHLTTSLDGQDSVYRHFVVHLQLQEVLST